MRKHRGAFFWLWALFLLFLPAVVRATPAAFTPDFFKRQVQEALAEEGEEKLIRILTALHGKMRTYNYPNCFECVLWLVHQSTDISPAKRLVLAEYAPRFAPDLPESHFYRFTMVLSEQPSDFALVASSFGRWISTTIRWVHRDVFLGAVLHSSLLLAAAIFFSMMLVMMIKYGTALMHLYSHVGAFSLFHKAIGLVTAAAAVVLAAKGVIGLEVFFLLWILFSYRVARYREIALLILLTGIYLVTDTAITVLSHSAPRMSKDRWETFRAVYSPPFAGTPHSDGSSASLFALGMRAFYDQNWGEADRLFASYGRDSRSAPEIARAANLRGIVASENGKREAARKFFAEAVKHDEQPAYLFNLSRALYAEGNLREAEEVEMRSIAIGGKGGFDYPALTFPTPYAFAQELSGHSPPPTLLSDPLLIRLATIIALILAMSLMWRIGGARTTVARCVECGGLLCEECGGDTEEVCLSCRILKSGKGLASSAEQKRHAERRERWSIRRRSLSLVLSVVVPGGGLIYNDHIVEGFFYTVLCGFLFTAAASATPHFLSLPGSLSSVPFALSTAFIVFAALLWFAAVLRSWHTAGTDE